MSNQSHIVEMCDFTSVNHERYEWLNVLFGQIRQEVTLAQKYPSSQSSRLQNIGTIADIAHMLTEKYESELSEQKQAANERLQAGQ